MRLAAFIVIATTFLPNTVLADWRTCIPHQCSQVQATFKTLDECIRYQRYQGSTWAKCFQV